jgi:hypothetical protein
VEQHQLRLARPQLPRELRLAGDRRRRSGRGAARQPARLSGPHDDPDLPHVTFFDQPAQSITENGIKTRLYTVNQDADQWHAALVWHADGNLYTLSEHVAPPLTFDHVVRYLKQELKSLVRIKPAV